MISEIKKKCKEEIEWAQENIKEMELPGNPSNYTLEDREYLPCWKEAHQGILNIILKKEQEEKSKETIEITKEEYIRLRIAEESLNRLEAGGIDNWEWYEESLGEDDYVEKITREVMEC